MLEDSNRQQRNDRLIVRDIPFRAAPRQFYQTAFASDTIRACVAHEPLDATRARTHPELQPSGRRSAQSESRREMNMRSISILVALLTASVAGASPAARHAEVIHIDAA